MPSLESTQPERRHLTVMFCDLVDFTTLADQIDPEDLRDVILAYQNACEDIIRKYGGHIAQYLGDGILVYFGFPSARENDAQRAVVSALKIVDRIRDLPLPNGLNQKLQVRIGIHTGQVVVGDMGSGEKLERIAVGTAPNIAAKILQAAGNNETLITASTRILVQGHFDCDALGQYPVRGLSTPIDLFKVLGEKILATRFDSVLTKGLTPFVGRENELNLLHDKWNLAKNSEGQVVLIKGEAGIGKSRLVYEFKNGIINEPLFAHTFQCLPEYQNSAFYPLIMFYNDLLGFGGDDSDEDRIHKLETFVGKKEFSLEESVPLLASLLSINLSERYIPVQTSPAKQKEKTIELLVSTLLKDTEERSLLLVVEDAHWIDPSTLEFLNSLIGKVRNTNILVLITYRPEFKYEWGDRANLTNVELGALDAEEVEDIVNKIRDEQGYFKEIVKEVVKRSDGVPLYVEELTKTILEANEVSKNQIPKYSNIPSSLSDLLMERLDRLGKAKEVAQIGSLIGGAFLADTLHSFGSLQKDTIMNGIRTLLDAGLLIEINDDKERKYDFKHMMIKEAAYNSMLRARRLMLHKKYGEILEEKFPKIIETNPEIAAYHYTEADISDKAIPYWTNAGKKAHLRFALDEAINHINNGLVLVKKLPENSQHIEQELNLQLNLGLVWCDKNSFTGPEVERAFFRALELSEKIGNEFLRFHTLYGLTYYYSFVNVKMTHQLIDEMRKIGESTNNPDILASYFTLKGAHLTWGGELELSLEYFDKTSSICGSNRDNTVHYMDRTLNNLGYKTLTLCIMGFPDRANKHFYDSKIVSDSNIYQIWSFLYETLLHQLRNDHVLTKRLSGELIELSTSYGQLYCICTGEILRGWSLSQEGNLIDGINDMKKGIDVFKELGMILIIPYYVGLLVEAYLKLGEFETALKLLDKEMDDIKENGLLWHEPEFNRLKGALLFAKSNEMEAEKYFLKAIESAQRQKAKLWEIRAVKDYCRLMMKQGRHTEAKEMLSEIYNWFTEGFDTKDLIEAKALLDELSRN